MVKMTRNPIAAALGVIFAAATLVTGVVLADEDSLTGTASGFSSYSKLHACSEARSAAQSLGAKRTSACECEERTGGGWACYVKYAT